MSKLWWRQIVFVYSSRVLIFPKNIYPDSDRGDFRPLMSTCTRICYRHWQEFWTLQMLSKACRLHSVSIFLTFTHSLKYTMFFRLSNLAKSLKLWTWKALHFSTLEATCCIILFSRQAIHGAAFCPFLFDYRFSAFQAPLWHVLVCTSVPFLSYLPNNSIYYELHQICCFLNLVVHYCTFHITNFHNVTRFTF